MKLLIFSQEERREQSASAWYRALFPFDHLSRKMGFEYTMVCGADTIARADLYKYDVTFFMRPHDPAHALWISAVKDMGKRVWIDYDDDLFAIPFDHEEWDYFQLDSTKKAILDSCELADVITVTTENLRLKLVSRGVSALKVFVVPNAINDYLFPEPTPHNSSTQNVICWRGGKTHNRDLETIGPAVSILMKQNYRFIFMGHNPTSIENYLIAGQYSRLAASDIFTYFHTLKFLHSPFHVVPLAANDLNAAKSNLAYLEASWLAGSVVFTPDGVNWEGTTPYLDAQDFVNQLKIISNNVTLCTDAVRASHEHIRDGFTLSRVNVSRETILKDL